MQSEPDSAGSISPANLCELCVLDEDTIVDTLRRRFEGALYYTLANHVCVAVNPYRSIPLPSFEQRLEFARHPLMSPHPHVFAVSGLAINALTRGQDQSIVVNGESGAGKTETIKLLLSHMTEFSDGGSAKEIATLVLGSVAVLESFGNAATCRNDNSSRFGTLLSLHYGHGLTLLGSQCSAYLLEKCRVVQQGCGHGDENFHVFYELLNAPDDEKMSLELGGLTTQDFRYTQRSPQSALTCVRYASRFKETQTTLRSLLRSNAHSAEDVLSLLAAVLHLGEVEQEWNSDRPALVRGASVTHLVPLLGLEPDDLDDGLCHRVIQVAGKDIKVPLSAEQSAFTRDALAKDIYDRLFSCLVNAVNIQLSGDTPRHSPAPETSRKIALLDIFGFESFGCNRFEQLCINYVNEALQQRFARDTIVTVQAEYLAEGVPWEPVRFTDNSTVLDLLHGRAGVITLLNDECQVPGGSEAGFLNKLRIAHGACDRLRIDPTKPGAFSVVHYAGTVTYDCTAFLKKNRDALPSHTASVMLRSKISLLTLLFRSDKSTVAQPTGRSPAQHRMAPTTICSKLRTELRSLLKQLDASQVHYVRCLKPNSSKSSCEFHPALVARQLRSGGLVEAVRVIRSAYPHKMPHLECFRMCRRLRSGDAVDDTGQQTQLAQLLCERCHLNVKVGVSRVYFAPGAYESMMGMVAAVELQSWWRGRRCRREYWRVRCGVVKFQALVRAGQSRHRQAQSLAAAVVLQTWARVMARRLAFLRMLDSTRRIQALLRRGIARRRARERRRHRVVIQRALLCWLLRRLRRVEGVAVTEPGFCCSRSTQTVSGGGDMVGGCGGRVRLSRCERFLEACQEVRDCLPRRWDPRSWTAEGVYELCSFIVGATAAVALYAFHCSADGTDK